MNAINTIRYFFVINSVRDYVINRSAINSYMPDFVSIAKFIIEMNLSFYKLNLGMESMHFRSKLIKVLYY